MSQVVRVGAVYRLNNRRGGAGVLRVVVAINGKTASTMIFGSDGRPTSVNQIPVAALARLRQVGQARELPAVEVDWVGQPAEDEPAAPL